MRNLAISAGALLLLPLTATAGSFSEWSHGNGNWRAEDHVLGQLSQAADCRSFAPLTKWKDYIYTVDARKVGGREGFLVLFRVRDQGHFYWWNVGGWMNTTHAVETRGPRKVFQREPGSIEQGRWYKIKIKVEGSKIECYLDGKPIQTLTDESYASGGIGLGSWLTSVQYKNVKVTSIDGKTVLYKTPHVDAAPDPESLADRKLSDAERAKRKAELAKALRLCPPIAFIKRRSYGMVGTNGTMFGRRTGSGSAICTFDPAAAGGEVKTIFKTEKGFIYNMNPSYDGKKLVFAYKEESHLPFHLWEIHTDGTGLKQLTRGNYHDHSPVYYPDGRIVFSSSRVEAYSMCQNYIATALYIMKGDGADIRRIDFTSLCTLTPAVLQDGSILCTRWEYQDKNIFSWEGLWTLNPNGRQLKLYHGNTLVVPNAVYGAREIPGTRKVILTMAAHHHIPIGDIAIVDRSLGVENHLGMRKVTHGTPYKVTPSPPWQKRPDGSVSYGLGNWRPGDKIYPNAYADPYPIDPDHAIVSFRGQSRTHDLYLLDLRTGEQALLLKTDRSCFTAVSLAPRTKPHVIPGDCPQQPGEGTFYVQDVYQGLLRQGVQRGQVKRLRIMAQLPKKYNTEGPRIQDHYPLIGWGSYYVKINFGTVPVYEDGSAFFKAPSNTELYFIALDENGKEIQRMGSVTQITTGERASCVGCHEDRLSAPIVHRADFERMQSPPDKIAPPPWGAGPVDYVKQVQPVLDKHCVKCHNGPNPKGNIDLTGDKTRFFNMSFVNLVITRPVVDYYYINKGPTGIFPAMMTGSWTSKLTRLIENKHGRVDVDDEGRRRIYCWIDANVPYYSTWDMTRPHTIGGRDVFYRTIKSSGIAQPGRATKIEPWAQKLQALVKKMNGKKARLSHGDINLTHPEYSDILTMNLARSAGGNADDKQARFKSKTDPLFVDILNALKEGKAALEATPRMDMPGAKPLPQERNFGRPL